jgi:tetratricopeptide (TPR) repeat protein
MRARVLVVWVLLASAVLGTHTPVLAQAVAPPPDSAEGRARESFNRGRIHYENGEFEAAALAFEEAYALSGRDALLYNLYLAYRDANQQEKAAEALKNYLDRVEVIENRAQLEARLKSLQAGIEQKRKQEEAQRAEAVKRVIGEPTNQPPRPDEPVEEQGKWWLMPTVVTGVGALMMVGSIPTGLMAKSKQDELEKKCPDKDMCDPSLQATADSGKTLSYVTDGLLFGGAAVAVVGAVLMFVKKRDADDATAQARRPQPQMACSTRGCSGSVSFRF